MRFRGVFLASFFSVFVASSPAFAQTISGSILGNGGVHVGGAVQLRNSSGDILEEPWVNEFGDFESRPLANGTYFATTIYTHEVLDEAWENIPCENLICDIPASTPIVIDGADRSGIDFILDPILAGGRISGQVKASPEVPLPDVRVEIKNIKLGSESSARVKLTMVFTAIEIYSGT